MILLPSVYETDAERARFEAMCFDAFVKKVDAACINLCGVSVHDLDNCPLRDWFEAGESHIDCARRVIRIARDGEGLRNGRWSTP